MADDDQRFPCCMKLADPRQTLLLKGFVADGEDLVDQQDVDFVWIATENASRRNIPDE